MTNLKLRNINESRQKPSLAIHDYGGHPFSLDLAKALHDLGYRVGYFYTSANRCPNSGSGKTAAFPIVNIPFPTIRKTNFVLRKFQELAYGRRAIKYLAAFKPDILLSSTTPLDAQWQMTRWANKHHIKNIFWFQDIIGLAARRILPQKLGRLGKLIANQMCAKEKQIVLHADYVIGISNDFKRVIKSWGYDLTKVSIIPNWAPVADLPKRPKENSWSQTYGLADKFVFLYTGTLGMKHNPDMLLQLALSFQDTPQVRIVVISEEMGANWLRAKKVQLQLDNLILLPFQSFQQMPEILGSADVLIALLTQDAGNFSVPSKILTYLCAAKPLLLAVPRRNQAAILVKNIKGGILVNPGDQEKFISSAHQLLADNELRKTLGQNCLHAEKQVCDLNLVVQEFAGIFSRLYIS